MKIINIGIPKGIYSPLAGGVGDGDSLQCREMSRSDRGSRLLLGVPAQIDNIVQLAIKNQY